MYIRNKTPFIFKYTGHMHWKIQLDCIDPILMINKHVKTQTPSHHRLPSPKYTYPLCFSLLLKSKALLNSWFPNHKEVDKKGREIYERTDNGFLTPYIREVVRNVHSVPIPHHHGQAETQAVFVEPFSSEPAPDTSVKVSFVALLIPDAFPSVCSDHAWHSWCNNIDTYPDFQAWIQLYWRKV